MGSIRVRDLDGQTHELDAVEGWRVMEIIRAHGLGIEALCGGACECATCHVHVAPEWQDRISPPTDDEENKLDEIPLVETNSRLSCQIIYCEALDGLELAIAKPV